MADFLDRLAKDSRETINDGYYEALETTKRPAQSLKAAIEGCKKAPVVAEIKFASPSMSTLRENRNLKELAHAIEGGGAIGLSVLTEPKHFQGRLELIREAKAHVGIPVLMKDFVLGYEQVDAAYAYGASAVLLIQAVFDRDYGSTSLQEIIGYTHSKGLEVLLEAHTAEEFRRATTTNADLIGINNRDLKTFTVNLQTTKRILERQKNKDRIIVSESGIETAADVRFLKKCGAHGFLVGSAVMKSADVKLKVRELVNAF